MDKIEIYIDELLEKSTPDRPIWNIEKILQGLKSTWNYIDGCMIKAILEMYAITKDEKYFRFADNFIDCKVREDGSIEGYSVEELNIDNVNAGSWYHIPLSSWNFNMESIRSTNTFFRLSYSALYSSPGSHLLRVSNNAMEYQPSALSQKFWLNPVTLSHQNISLEES